VQQLPNVVETGISAQTVPYVHHRRISQDNVAASGLALPPNVIRLPRGPDKNTRGFQRWCKSRMNSNAPQAEAASSVSQTIVEEQKPRLGMHKRGSHAVAIVAPPKEEKSEPKSPQKKAELVKDDMIETVEKKPDTVEKEEETVKPAHEKEIESSSSISASAEPSAPPAEEGSPGEAQNIPVANVPVVQGRIIIEADSDTCSDSGNDSEPEVDGGLDRAEAVPQPGPPSFAANLSMDHDDEKSR
jgi:hypothetical protein